jgi:hypothetical protein
MELHGTNHLLIERVIVFQFGRIHGNNFLEGRTNELPLGRRGFSECPAPCAS